MTLIEPNTSAELLSGCESNLGLRLRLCWNNDRFDQSIDIIVGGEATSLFRSSDEKDDADWPTSPPLQQVSLEQIADKDTFLGVGQAGTSHWSVSIEPCNSEAPGLRFDYACRCSSTPEFVGSRYLWPDGVDCKTDAFAGNLFRVGDAVVQVAPDDETSIVSCYNDRQMWEVRPEVSGDGTIRWSYQIQIM